MTTTVILPVFNNSVDVVKSISSIFDNNVHPSNLCIITHESTDENKIAVIDAFFKSCCDEPSSEEVTLKYKITKKIASDITLYKITTKEKIIKHPVYYIPETIYNDTDIFLTIAEGISYKPDFIEKYSKALSDPAIGAVYSDYIVNNNYIFLQSMHIMMREMVDIGEIGFKKSIINKKDLPFVNRDLVYQFYGRSIISHIPEALFVI